MITIGCFGQRIRFGLGRTNIQFENNADTFTQQTYLVLSWFDYSNRKAVTHVKIISTFHFVLIVNHVSWNLRRSGCLLRWIKVIDIYSPVSTLRITNARHFTLVRIPNSGPLRRSYQGKGYQHKPNVSRPGGAQIVYS